MEEYQKIWSQLIDKLQKQFGGEMDITEALYLVGVQELGEGFREFSKQEKMDLIHIGNCKALSYFSYYKYVDNDADGWPRFEKDRPLPKLLLKDQEALIKKGIIEYFQEIEFIS